MGQICDKLRNSILFYAFNGEIEKTLNSKYDVENIISYLEDNNYKINIKENKFFEPTNDWIWSDIETIFKHNTGKALNKSKMEGKPYSYLTTSNLYWNNFDLSEVRVMLFKDSEVEKCSIRKGDLLICEGGDAGRTAIWDSDESFMIQNHIHRLRAKYKINPKFYYYLMYLYKHANFLVGKGIAIKSISSGALGAIPAPIVNIEVQNEIVDKIDELMAKIDELEVIEGRLNDLKEKFPNLMKESILQAAFEGKLTKSSVLDTPLLLLENIRKEKEYLESIKEIPKISKSNKIDENESFIEIKENWSWIRLNDLATVITDYVANGSFATLKEHTKTNKNKDYAIFVRTVDLSNNFKNDLLYIDEKSYNWLEKSRLYGGELVLPNVGSVGKSFTVPNLGVPMSLAPNSVLIKFKYEILNRFMSYYFLSPFGQKYLNNTKSGTAMQKISKTVLKQMILPLPPLSEIESIVALLDKLLPLCDGLVEGDK